MTQGINPILPGGMNPAGGVPAESKANGVDFKDVLIKSIGEVNDMQLDAETAINNLAAGKTQNVTEVMAAVEKADIAFKNLMAIRNKIIDAYKEIQQLRI
jgi:flagellar hook-basal body complex protein FliE